jgi:hypothetical protein
MGYQCSSNIIPYYATTTNTINQLNIQPDPNSPGNYLLWDFDIPEAQITLFTQEANQHVFALIGDITTGGPSYRLYLAQQLAAKFAAYRLISMMAINWTVTGMTVAIGSVNINRLPALQAAVTEVKSKLLEDINRLTLQVLDPTTMVSVVNNYAPRQDGTQVYGVEPS